MQAAPSIATQPAVRAAAMDLAGTRYPVSPELSLVLPPAVLAVLLGVCLSCWFVMRFRNGGSREDSSLHQVAKSDSSEEIKGAPSVDRGTDRSQQQRLSESQIPSAFSQLVGAKGRGWACRMQGATAASPSLSVAHLPAFDGPHEYVVLQLCKGDADALVCCALSRGSVPAQVHTVCGLCNSWTCVLVED